MYEFTPFDLIDAIHAGMHDGKMTRQLLRDVAAIVRQLRDPRTAKSFVDQLEGFIWREAPYLGVCRYCVGDLRTESYTEAHPYGSTVALERITVRTCEQCGEDQ